MKKIFCIFTITVMATVGSVTNVMAAKGRNCNSVRTYRIDCTNKCDSLYSWDWSCSKNCFDDLNEIIRKYCKPVYCQTTTEQTTQVSTEQTTEQTTQATTAKPTQATTQQPTTAKPTQATTQQPTTAKPTQATTQQPTTAKPTQATTQQPTTTKPTQATTQQPTTTKPTTEQTTEATTTSTVSNNTAQEILNLVNKERAANGLSPLTLNNSVSKVAQAKAEDMQKNNYFSHTSPNYGSPFDMMKSFGVSYRTAGENIAKGQKTPQAVMTAWMNSEGHRKNILNGSFTQLGVGYVNKNGTTYWVQMFIG